MSHHMDNKPLVSALLYTSQAPPQKILPSGNTGYGCDFMFFWEKSLAKSDMVHTADRSNKNVS